MNEDNKIGKKGYFELREKRLKLVYKILYIIVAIWIALVISIGNADLTTETTPIYAFLLSVSSLCIIKILKYALMEFRCMKIVGELSQEVLVETETRYENIWKSFSVVLAFSALFMLLHILFPQIFNQVTCLSVAGIGSLYFSVLSIFDMVKPIENSKDYSNQSQEKENTKLISILNLIGVILGIAVSYSICSFVCGVMVNA